MNNVDDLVEVRSEASNGVGLVKLTFQKYVDMNTALSQATGHTAVAQEVPTVRTVTPAKASEATIYEFPGRTEPVDSAAIFTRATGIIRERRFEIGDLVKSDDALTRKYPSQRNRC